MSLPRKKMQMDVSDMLPTRDIDSLYGTVSNVKIPHDYDFLRWTSNNLYGFAMKSKPEGYTWSNNYEFPDEIEEKNEIIETQLHYPTDQKQE